MGAVRSRPPFPAIISPDWRGWVAGLFEGEGYIGAHKAHGRHYARMVINMTDRDVLERFQQVTSFGNLSGPKDRGRPEWTPMHTWETARFDEVLTLLGIMWPYLGQRRRLAAHATIRLHLAKKGNRTYVTRRGS